MAVTSDTKVYAVGEFSGTADFDPGPGSLEITSSGNSMYVQKLDPNGDIIWVKALGGSSFVDISSGLAVVTDSSENVFSAGYFSGTVDFDPGAGSFDLTANGDRDIFVLKLDSDGNFVWARAMGGTGDDLGLDIAVDASGGVYTTGYFSDTVDFDPGLGTLDLTSAGLNDMFVQKLDSSGNLAWVRSIGGPVFDEGDALALDGFGNIYVTGGFGGTVDFDSGPGTFTLVGTSAAYVLKLDSAGNFVWANAINDAFGDGLALDSAGNVCTVGYYSGTTDFDPGAQLVELTSAGGGDIYIRKLDAAGNLLWARSVGGAGLDLAEDVAIDAYGSVYITGNFGGTVDFDPGDGSQVIVGSGSDDTFLLKLNAGGEFVWAESTGGATSDLSRAVAVDNETNVYTTGLFTGTVDFDPGAGILNIMS